MLESVPSRTKNQVQNRRRWASTTYETLGEYGRELHTPVRTVLRLLLVS